ncbi:hypothetical protein L596_010903 [Steinernema carpocapsae]|uniref:Methyltransferase type 11 domain-containing protein n=1 Tax=Steinernema carpocapsae TaxID=34508 RepID=A0A4U5PJQ8_STECR|nr:hypothetical protein L596_010903 [Steinernema carpocapsae]
MQRCILIIAFLAYFVCAAADHADFTVCKKRSKLCLSVAHSEDTWNDIRTRMLQVQLPDNTTTTVRFAEVIVPFWIKFWSISSEERLALPIEKSACFKDARDWVKAIDPPLYPRQNVLNLGLGDAGWMTNCLLNNWITRPNVTTVEADQMLKTITKKYFGVYEDPLHRIVIEKPLTALQKLKRGAKFDTIIVNVCDVFTWSYISCSPSTWANKQFVEGLFCNLKSGGKVLYTAPVIDKDKKFVKLFEKRFRNNCTYSRTVVEWLVICTKP